jgi:cell division protein FtsL
MDESIQKIRNLFKTINKLTIVKKVLLALAVFIFLAFSFWIYITTQVAQYYDVNKNTVDEFLTFMSQEDYLHAYALFANKYKKEEDFENFKKIFSSVKLLL